MWSQRAEGTIAELQMATRTFQAELRVAKSEASDKARAKEEAATLAGELATVARRIKVSSFEHQHALATAVQTERGNNERVRTESLALDGNRSIRKELDLVRLKADETTHSRDIPSSSRIPCPGGCDIARAAITKLQKTDDVMICLYERVKRLEAELQEAGTSPSSSRSSSSPMSSPGSSDSDERDESTSCATSTSSDGQHHKRGRSREQRPIHSRKSQPRLRAQASMEVPSFPQVAALHQYTQNLYEMACICGQDQKPDDVLAWLRAVEHPNAKRRQFRDPGPGFAMLDRKLAAALTPTVQNELKRTLQNLRAEGVNNNRLLWPRDVVRVVQEFRDVTESLSIVQHYGHREHYMAR